MTKHNHFLLSAFCLLSLLFASSCSDDNPAPSDGNGDGDGNGATSGTKYIIASHPVASEGVADYLLTVDDLTTGSISTVGNGIEQDGTYRYYTKGKNKFFSLLYGQGNPGAVTIYGLNEQGDMTRISNFQSETVQAFAPVNDDILMMKIPRSNDNQASWYRVGTNENRIVGEGQIDIVALAGNGERAHFTWMTQVGDKVFAPYMGIKGCCDDVFGTQYPDSSWVAVYSYPEMALETVIKDNRTSYIGRYFVSGLEVDENGDAYAFSSSVATNSGAFTSTKPSAVTRINSGETTFDQSYLFNLEEASNGYYVTNQNYVGNGKFILMMLEEKVAYAAGNRLAIADVYNQTFTWVEGAPDPATITNITDNNLTLDDKNTAFVGITTEEGSYVYQINAATATATRGIRVEGGQITAISSLTY